MELNGKAIQKQQEIIIRIIDFKYACHALAVLNICNGFALQKWVF